MRAATAILSGLGAAPAVAARAAVAVGAIDPVRIIPEALASDWHDLAAVAAEPNAFAEPWFVAASLRHLAPDGVHLLTVRSANRLLGVLPLSLEPSYGRIPVRHVENWRHHHLFLGTPLIRAGDENAFWTAALEALDASRWARGFLHLVGLVEDGPVHRSLNTVATQRGSAAAVVHREERAFLCSDLAPTAYYEATVRKKKRKEIARLRNRLDEVGVVRSSTLTPADDLGAWCDAYLALESAGWKGKEGSALACDPATQGFFRDALAGAAAAGRLELRRLDLDQRPVAMLVNFLASPGSFSFKTAFDEEFARFSPGVLIQLDNLAILNRSDIDWMDSCAAAGHPMIDSLWGERRTIVRVSVPLRGTVRRATFAATRLLEEAAASRRRRLAGRAAPAIQDPS